jgi:hypothetical protein
MNRRDLTSEVAQDHFDVEAEARRRGIQPYQVRATQAVGDKLVADIVADARRGIPQSASMIPPSREPAKPKGTGWVEAAPLKSPDTRWIDAQIDAQDQRDRAAAVRVRVETELAEAMMRDKISYKAKTEYHPYSRDRMGFDDDD